MAKKFELALFYEAEADDLEIAFNFDREHYSDLPRTLAVYPDRRDRKLVFPGVELNREKELFEEICRKQRKKLVEKHGCKIKSRLHSFLWRRMYGGDGHMPVLRVLGPLPPKTAKAVEKKWKSYLEYLGGSMKAGNVYLAPDNMVGFGPSHRRFKPYSRPILISDIDTATNRVKFIPFSTRLSLIDEKRDLLFDVGHQGPALDRNISPAVENFPYEFATRTRTALRISAQNSVSIDKFLQSVLHPMGALRPQALDFIRSQTQEG